MHDPRIGRFFAVDPLARKYAFNSPYAFAENRVMQFNELEGLEIGLDFVKAKLGIYGKTVQTLAVGAEDIVRDVVSGAVTVSTSVAIPVVNQFNIVRTEGIHGGGALQSKHYIFTPGVRKLDENWNLVNMGISDEGNKEVFKATISTMGTAIPLEKAAAPIAKVIFNPAFKAGSRLVTASTKLFGGSIITLSKTKTTTVLGRFFGGIEHIKATGMFRMGENRGGVNILNVPDAQYKKAIAAGGDEAFWNQYNKPWLDEAISRGDNIRLVSDPTDPANLFINKVDDSGGRTMFGREVEHLDDKGYIFEGANAVKK